MIQIQSAMSSEGLIHPLRAISGAAWFDWVFLDTRVFDQRKLFRYFTFFEQPYNSRLVKNLHEERDQYHVMAFSTAGRLFRLNCWFRLKLHVSCITSREKVCILNIHTTEPHCKFQLLENGFKAVCWDLTPFDEISNKFFLFCQVALAGRIGHLYKKIVLYLSGVNWSIHTTQAVDWQVIFHAVYLRH